ncbi:Uma2 family endonuclease [Kitasatospora sp. NPDC006697]|uniref:Uma2 family endonuclease n=1 Tax=Kitasatospora sp. NPDC006697 TaxID=3364020 RepID=UPI0036C77D61
MSATAIELGDGLDPDEALWQTWLAMELPEGLRAEIIEGFIEVSPTGGGYHSLAANRLRRRLDSFLSGTQYAAHQDTNVIFRHNVLIPDVLVTLEDLVEVFDPANLGAMAEHVTLVVEVVSPGHGSRERDWGRKQRAYARAAIPVYVIVDDHDGSGHVTVHSQPNPAKGLYEASARVPYGTPVAIPEGPAKGFVIDTTITGEPRPAE